MYPVHEEFSRTRYACLCVPASMGDEETKERELKQFFCFLCTSSFCKRGVVLFVPAWNRGRRDMALVSRLRDARHHQSCTDLIGEHPW